MTNEIDLTQYLGDTFKMPVKLFDDAYGSVYECYRCVGDTCSRCIVRILSHEIDVEKANELKSKLSEEDYLTYDVVSNKVIATNAEDYTRLSQMITSNETQLSLSEFECCGLVNRVNSILLKNEKDGINVYSISPSNLFVKPIEDVRLSDRKTNHTLKIGEPYLALISESKADIREKDPYVAKNFQETKKRAMSWSLGMLMYELSFGSVFDGSNRQNQSLSYEFSRLMFELLHDDPDLRMELSTAQRRMNSIKDCEHLILYESVKVENLILHKGIYDGEIRYGLMHGFGHFESTREFGLSNEVSKYTGIYCLDKMHIKGEITYRNNDVYSGQISWDAPKGKGVFTKSTGMTLVGEFEGTTLVTDSYAEIRDPDPTDGWYYKGTVSKNQPSGEGKMTYPDGYEYIGSFEKGMRSGKGVLTHEDEGVQDHKYEGNWQDNLKHGEGEEYKSGELRYEGNYNLGLFEGDGKLENIKEQWKYEGEFKGGKPHGFGQMYWEDGTVYRGQLKAGQRDGYGTCEYADGTSYDGQWARDKKNGEGTFITEEGWSSVKIFIDDEAVS